MNWWIVIHLTFDVLRIVSIDKTTFVSGGLLMGKWVKGNLINWNDEKDLSVEWENKGGKK